MAKKDKNDNYEIVRLDKLSGHRCSFYSVYVKEDNETLFDKFLKNHEAEYGEALDNILDRIDLYAYKYGAKAKDFKFEGSKIGEFAHALRDYPKKKLRLYCIRYSTTLVILGGGAPKNVDTWQEDDALKTEVEFMFEVADIIAERLESKEIRFSNDFLDLEGKLTF